MSFTITVHWRASLKIHGITLTEGSDAKNLVVTSGGTLPASPNVGELFYLTGPTTGLHVYDGVDWIQVDSQPDLPEPGTTGIVVKTGVGNSMARSVAGDAGEITVVNGDGVAGNPTIGIADNAVLPGTQHAVLPTGNSAQRGTATAGGIRYNSELARVEAFAGGEWRPVTAPLTTKGDMYVRSATTDDRLPVGGDGQLLMADSTAALGVRWTNNVTAGGSFDGGHADTVYAGGPGLNLGGSI